MIPRTASPEEGENFCSLCGFEGDFLRFHPDSSLRETRCPECGSARRTRDVARVLLALANASTQRPLCEQLAFFEPLRIFELQAAGPLHAQLKTLPHYQCSEFFPAILPGQRNEKDVLCQDATCLTFPDGAFDIVISQDILEHIDDTWRAFAEINRVLDKDGAHVFTVPVNEGTFTRKRQGHDAYGQHFKPHGDGKQPESISEWNQKRPENETGRPEGAGPIGQAEQPDQARQGGQKQMSRERNTQSTSLPPIYHGDPLNPEGALVCWDFGDDLTLRLAHLGIAAKVALQSSFYAAHEICKTESDEDHRRYLALRAQKQLSRFFLYNSIVFVAKPEHSPA